MSATQVRPIGPVVAAAGPPMMHASAPQQQQPAYIPVLAPQALAYFTYVIDQTIRADQGESHLEHIINRFASELHRQLQAELQAWKIAVAERHGVILSDPLPNVNKSRPPKHGMDSEDEDDADDSKQGNWRCLFNEHDPKLHSECTKRYKRVSELRRHIKTHTLPHYCDKCGYRTAEERRLVSHKCEESNRTKYKPMSPEEKEKNEKLARMGVGVGEMRIILFGPEAASNRSKRRKGEDDSEQPDAEYAEYETEQRPSRSPSIKVTAELEDTGINGSAIMPGYSHPPHSRTPSGHTISYTSGHSSPFSGQSPYHPPTVFTNGALSVPYPLSPIRGPEVVPFDPQRPELPIAHSPTSGAAGEYYMTAGTTMDYLSPVNMGLSDTSSASPSSNQQSPQSLADMPLPNFITGLFNPDEVPPEQLPPELRERSVDFDPGCAPNGTRGVEGEQKGPGLVSRLIQMWQKRQATKRREAADAAAARPRTGTASSTVKGPLQNVWRRLSGHSLQGADEKAAPEPPSGQERQETMAEHLRPASPPKGKLSSCAEGLGRWLSSRWKKPAPVSRTSTPTPRPPPPPET